jgi:ribokinase
VTVNAVVVGSLNADLITTVDRIPLVGETRQALGVRRGAGGKGANQAVALARLGASVTMVGCVGDDEDGRTLVAGLTTAGVATGYLSVTPAAPTGLALVMVDRAGDNAIVIIPGANGALADIPAAAFGRVDVVVAQQEIPLPAVRAALLLGAPALRVLNAAPARTIPADVLTLVDVLVVNESEARELGGDADPGAAARALRARGVGTVVVTLGAAGALLVDADGAVHASGFNVRTVDTTGAGDCFVAALALALADHQPPVAALRFANAAAALAVTRPGAQAAVPTREEVESFLATSSSASV